MFSTNMNPSHFACLKSVEMMQNTSGAMISPASSTYNTRCESFGTAKTGQTETKLGFLKEHKGRMLNRF